VGAPALCYDPGPGGLPNRMLWHRPGGRHAQMVTLGTGDKALLLTGRHGVKVTLSHGSMQAGQAHTSGNWLRSDLDLLNRDPPELTAIKDVILPITDPGGPAGRLRSQALDIARRLDFRSGPVDLVQAIVKPYLLLVIAADMGLGEPAEAEPVLDTTFRAGLVQFTPDDVAAAAWAETYARCGRLTTRLLARPDGSVASRCAAALADAGYSSDQIMHVLATLWTGYPSLWPVLIAALFEFITTPGLLLTFARGSHRDRVRIVGRILHGRANFATSKVRILATPVTADGEDIPAGFPLVPSVWAALQAGAGWSLAYGLRPHRCTSVAASMTYLTIILAAVAITYSDGLQLAEMPSWPPSLLSVPPTLMALPGTGLETVF
jgi:hypothetical protein